MLRWLNGRSLCNVVSISRFMSTTKKIQRDHEKALKKFFVDKIKATGPITVAEYMKTAVSAPNVGFYGGFTENKQIFGNKGDFITSPELTQLFGEMIGVWIYHELANTGHSGEWQLIECGPGSGTLMNDILSVFTKLSENKMYVKKNKSRNGIPVYWYKNLDDIPEGFSVFLANEFLDALPVHQFVRDDGGSWHEVYINIDQEDQLVFMNSKGENLHTRITYNGGFGLIIDYGHYGTRQDLSLRAYSQHQQVHPLSRPGAIDLTADVDFLHLKSLIMDRTLVYGPQNQREFLAQMGIELRLRRLLQCCSDLEKKKLIIGAYNYLMGDMGTKFHAMSVFPKTLQSILEKRGGPAGFSQGGSKQPVSQQ